jgi:hypothetical protein
LTLSRHTEKKEQELKAKLKIIHPTEEEILDGLMTALGMSASLTSFLAEIFSGEEEKMPNGVKYAMAITAGNMMALLSAHPTVEIEKRKYPAYKYIESEQIEEYSRRRFKEIIIMLYESLQREDDLNG